MTDAWLRFFGTFSFMAGGRLVSHGAWREISFCLISCFTFGLAFIFSCPHTSSKCYGHAPHLLSVKTAMHARPHILRRTSMPRTSKPHRCGRVVSNGDSEDGRMSPRVKPFSRSGTSDKDGRAWPPLGNPSP